jgi:hypothetical protein
VIASIHEALAKLREHGKFCQRLDCAECDLAADVTDLLRMARRLLEQAHRTATWPSVDLRDVIARDDWREEVRTLLAPLPGAEQTETQPQENES